MEKILGQSRINKDLKVLSSLSEDILGSRVVVLVRRRRARLLRHGRMRALMLRLVKVMLVFLILLLWTLTLIHSLLLTTSGDLKNADEEKR